MLLLLAVSLPGYCRTYFQEGMKWTVRTTNTDSPKGSASHRVYTIEKCQDGSEPALGIFMTQKDAADTHELVVYVMEEGEKIYFKLPDSKVRNWYLMYDFGLKPGEGYYFYTPYTNNPDKEPRRTFLKCISVDKDADWEKITIEEYIEFEGELVKQDKTGTWIKGLGSASGVLTNNRFNMDGSSSKLVKVSMGGELVYESPVTGVEAAEVSSFKVRVEGLDVKVCGIEKADEAVLYTDGGVVSGRYDLLPGKEATMRLPAPGVYILKTAAGAAKILAR